MSNIQVPGPKYGLNEIIDALTMKNIAERAKENKYNPLRPSGAGKCTKELGYEYMEFKGYAEYEKEPMSPSVSRLLNLGHKIEEHANNEAYYAFRNSPKPINIKYKQQTLSFFKMPDGKFLEGNLDLVIEIDGHLIVADWKSKSDKYSQFYKSSWEEFNEKLCKTGHAVQFGEDAVYITDLEKFIDSGSDPFFNNNLYQLNFYACNEFLKERGVVLASIIQYNKNDSRIREVRFTPSQAIFERTKAKFLNVANTVENEKSVESLNKDHMLGSMKCGFCNFRKHCWPENDALKTYFSSLPPKQWAKDLDRLPADAQKEITTLFEEYESANLAAEKVEKIEEKIVSTLARLNVYKIRLDKGRIYKIKRLKSGGPKDGDRMVLRRDKA